MSSFVFVFMETSIKQKNKKRELAVYETTLNFKRIRRTYGPGENVGKT